MKKPFTYTLDPDLLTKFHLICKENCLNKSRVIEFFIKQFVDKDGNIKEFKKK